MTTPIRPFRGRAPLQRGAMLLVLLLAGIGGEAGAAALFRGAPSSSEGRDEDASCHTWIVDGMMKSRSGPT